MLYREYDETVRAAVRFMENHLKEDLPLEKIARQSAFSMYHFHRLFLSIIGMTPVEYVRQRRLSHAAEELVFTDKRIIEIAIEWRFDSQEAFTRAFKKRYYMTPGQYRKFIPALIHRREQSDMAVEGTQNPYGWLVTGLNPQAYRSGTDYEIKHQGHASGFLESISEMPAGFGTLMQMFKAEEYKGQRIRFSGFARSEQVEEWAGLWMRVDGNNEEVLQFDNMGNRPINGTTPWTPYSIVLDVPVESVAIAFGVLLNGRGKVWIDSLRFDVVDEKVPLTGTKHEEDLPDQPVNLSFDEAPGQGSDSSS